MIDFEENLKKIRLRKVKNMANRPIKKFKSGSIEAAIWFNERERNGEIVGFKTVSLRRSWKDNKTNIWRDEVINLYFRIIFTHFPYSPLLCLITTLH